jgi:sterol 14-demethylase
MSAFLLAASPLETAKAIFDATPLWVTILVGLVTLYFLVTADFVSGRLPPRFNILAPLLTGKFKLEAEGPLAIVQAGYDKFGDIFRVKIAHRGLTFVIGPASKVFFSANDNELSQREVYHFTVPVFGKNIVYDAPPGVMIQQV